MTDGLVSLRIVVVSGATSIREMFGQAASACSLPIEIMEADTAASAARSFGDGADLVFVDSALSGDETGQIVAAARAVPNPPFTVLLTRSETAALRFETDALATKPARAEEAQRLLERSARVCVPSRVLVVDDSSTMRSIVRKILAATRFPLEVTEIDDGIAAINLARETEFDIVFLDYNMPGLNGLETLSEFKREKRRASVVMISSTQDAALAARARARGAAFLKKPFFPADIEAVLSGHYGFRALNPQRH